MDNYGEIDFLDFLKVVLIILFVIVLALAIKSTFGF